MSVGLKVALASGLLTAIAIAAVVVPGLLRAEEAATEDPAFDAVGSNAALALAAGQDPSALSARKSSAAGDAAKAIEGLLADAKKEIDDYRGDDEDEKSRLRQRRLRLVTVLDALRTPEAGGTRKIKSLSGQEGFDVLGARIVREGGAVVAERDAGVAIPAPATLPDYGSYPAQVSGREAEVFHAAIRDEAQRLVGRAFVAFAPKPPPPATGGGSPLGLVVLILGPLLVAAISYVVASGHARPLRDLARELDKIGSTGDPKRRIPAHGPEAAAIARSVERMVANLRFRDQHEGSDLAEAIAKEQGVAAEVHQGLMPKTSPRIAGYEVETLWKPGFEIGGDHFEYFQIDDRHLGVILLDTSVRGIRAALVMSLARAYVRAFAPDALSPGEVLVRVNKLLAEDLAPGQYVTALYVVIDTGSGSAHVASAGHLPLIVYRHAIGKTAIVNPEGIALGLDVGPVFEKSIEEVEVSIGVGDRLVLHTDGALKVQNEVGEEFGEARLYEAVKREAPKNSQAFVNFVGGAIDTFHVNTPQNDDITISTVKRLK
jgi:serine phosphatase RsbU (regulator of sigma subunit)